MCASERAESMRNTTRFGFFGFVASMCFFCLSTVTGSPHDSKPTDPLNPAAREDPLLLLTNAPFLHQLQEQNLAVLKALEQLREERDGALDRYNQTITSQLNILKDAFLFQREQELESARNSNRFILTIAAVTAGLAVLIMVFCALLPVWAMKRFAAPAALEGTGGLFAHAQASLWMGSHLPFLDEPAE